MSLSFPSPLCTVNAASTINGVNVTAASMVTIALADTAGVKQFNISCLNTDDLLSAATITAGLTIDTVAKTATFVAPAAGSALVFKSVVNNGKDANGAVDPSLTTTFGVYVLTTNGYRTAAFDETTEGSASFGWLTKFNAVVRNNLVTPASAGAGMTFGAGAYNVNANADGSIVVNADDIQLKTAYQTLLNGATAAATVGTLPLRAATTSFTGLACTTLAASSNATVGGTLRVTGASTLAGVSCTTLAASGNATIGGTLGVTGALTSAAHGCTTLTASSNATIGGTLGVTGATTCAALTSSTLTCSGNATVGGTLGVTAALTCAALSCSGVTNSGNATIAGTLGVTGATTCSALTCSSLTLSGTARVGLASRSVTRTVAAVFMPTTSNWTVFASGAAQTTSTSPGTGYVRLALPDGAVLQTVKVYVEGASGHAGAPATLPAIQVLKSTPSTGTPGTTNLTAAVIDTYASAAAYETVHAITISSIAHTVVRSTQRLTISITSEYNANAVAGFLVHGCDVTYTTTSYDDGPCN